MTEELKGRLEQLAYWHSMTTLSAPSDRKEFHSNAAADIRTAIVSADDATKNMLILRAHKAKDRRFSGEAITGFDQLEGQS